MISRSYLGNCLSIRQGKPLLLATVTHLVVLLTLVRRACITPQSAVAHIHHFCACLPRERYVNLTPVFSFTESPLTKRISATVTLPTCLIPSVRWTKGTGDWRTERSAVKDAAFQAYKVLYEAGLLNEHLLPLSHSWDEDEPNCQEDMAATVDIRPEFSPWKQLAELWSHCDIHQTVLTLKSGNGAMDEDLSLVLTTPLALPAISPIILNWDEETRFHLHFSSPRKTSLDGTGTIQTLRSITHMLTESTYSDQRTRSNKVDFVALFGPDLEGNQLPAWYEAHKGRAPALVHHIARTTPLGLIRSRQLNGAPHHFGRWYGSNKESGGEVEVQCTPLTKRQNFLNPHNLSQKTSTFTIQQDCSPALQSFPIQDCTVDRLSYPYARFSLFIQAILQQVRSFTIAEKLRSTILKQVPFNDLQNVVTAISARTAGLTTDYQRFEFFGDSVLKFLVSHQLFCDHENWHEGFLTKRKDHLVSNQKLAKVALDMELDEFIMTEGFKIRTWKPPLISEILEAPAKPRELSMKVLADVVEALVGAAYIDGGFDAARKCLHVFLPEIRSEPPQTTRSLPTTTSTSRIVKAESIIGYEFKKKTMLLEALTHPSYDHHDDMKTESYQRLEFLGDAVLDMVLIRLLASLQTKNTALSPGKMSWIKAALVSANFLGFLCLDYGIETTEVVRIEETSGGEHQPVTALRKSRLWTLMRHTCQAIKNAQTACQERYTTHRDSIHQALSSAPAFPWLPLARLNLDKFYSDMIESIVGAIFLDSEGSLAACEEFMTRVGLVPYLKRVLAEGVDMQHPKSILNNLSNLPGNETVIDVEALVPVGSDDTVGERYSCKVAVGDADIAMAENCLSRNEAILAAVVEVADKLRAKQQQQTLAGDEQGNKE
jgi:dsRNA-specific ribonuclease